MKNILFFMIVFVFTNTISAQVPQNERDALIQFFNTTNGPSLWTTSTNWTSTNPVSTWFGVTVTNINGQDHVTELNLPNNNIVASNGFPLSLTNLTELTKLNLWVTPMFAATTSLPSELQNLTKLTYIDLRGWQLSGVIPSELGNLTNLNWIDLRNNNLTGNIPQELTNLTNLSIFVVSFNQLSGVVPDFSVINGLNAFWYNNNNFEFGDIEPNYTNNQTINNHVYAGQNLIDSPQSIALATGSSITLNVNTTGAQNNYQWLKNGVILTGETNPTLNVTINNTSDYGNYTYQTTNTLVTNLTLISHNISIGDLPSNNPDYNALVDIYNSSNGANWTIKTNWLDNTKPIYTWHGVVVANNRVTALNLGGNNLTGTISPSIGNLSELINLYLWNNQLTGNIPPEIGNLSNLEQLDLSPNSFSGTIPEEIGNLTALKVLWLNQNGLTGQIPATFQNLVALEQLYLIGYSPNTSSTFSGNFPDLTGLTNLHTLNFSDNYFQFTDIENEFNHYVTNIPNFIFSPQFNLDLAEDVNATEGDDITLTMTDVSPSSSFTSNNSIASNTYQWFKNGSLITGATNLNYTISNSQTSDNGLYTAEIYNSATPNMVIRRPGITVNIGTLSVEDNEVKNIKIYPNPTKDKITIELANATISNYVIFDILGKKIISGKNSSKFLNLNVSAFKSGIYIIKLKSNTGDYYKRFIKK